MIVSWIYLALAVVCLSGLSLFMKLGGKKGLSTPGLVATACGIGTLFLAAGLCVTAKSGSFPLPLIRWGIFSGTVGTLGFLFYVKALKIGPYGFSVAVQPVSSLVPVLFALLFWKETLGISHGAGILLIFFGLLLIFVLGDSTSPEGKAKGGSAWVFLLILSVVLQGIPALSAAAVARFLKEGFIPFLFLAYLSGTMLSALPALRENIFTRAALPYALGGGICGVLGNFFVLKSFAHLPVTVVSPIVLAAPVMAAILLSHFLFHERITRLGYLGILAGVAGVCILSLK